jgi:hypothetical protein
MAKQIKAPDGSVINFPDDMDDSAIEQVMRRNFASAAQPAATQDQPSASLFSRLTPSANKITPSDIMKFRDEEEVGAPGVPIERAKAVAYPMLQMGAMGIGGATGGIPGAALGYAAAKGLERDISEYTGETPRQSLAGAAVTAAKDIGTGALYETGGKALAKALGGIASFGGKMLPRREAQSLESLGEKESQAWDRLRDSGSAYESAPFKQKAEETAIKQFNYSPDTHPAIANKNVLGTIDSLSSTNPTSINKLRTIRDLLSEVQNGKVVTKEGNIIPSSEKEVAMATALKRNLDDFVANQADEGAVAWKEARDVSSQIYKSKEAEAIINAAEKSTLPTSKVIRDKFNEILNSRLINSYTPEQQEVIKQIAEGTATQKTLETIGRLAPKSVTWRSILTAMGLGGGAVAAKLPGATTGAAILVPAFGAGLASRAAAGSMAKGQVRALDQLLRGGELASKVDLSFLAPYGTAGFVLGDRPSPQQLASALGDNTQPTDFDRQRRLAYQLSQMQNQEQNQ